MQKVMRAQNFDFAAHLNRKMERHDFAGRRLDHVRLPIPHDRPLLDQLERHSSMHLSAT